MLRRVRGFVFALVLFAPVVASASQAEADPNGLVSIVPTLVEALDVIVRVLAGYLGI